MKKMKKLASILLAAIMVLAMAVPAMAATMVLPDDLDGHTYVAYQIFKGEQAEGVANLGNIEWGDGVDETVLLEELAKTSFGEEEPFKADMTAMQVAEAMQGWDYDSANALLFAKIVSNHLSTTKENLVAGTNNLTAGYYLVVDTSEQNGEENGVTNLSLLQLTNDATQELTMKTSVPSVDKEVKDEAGDRDTESAEPGTDDGWGETADHDLNETFQFRLTATVPKDVKLSEYEKYKVVFHDSMSDGVTFENIVSVKINGKDVPVNKYASSLTGEQAGGEWTLTIEDIKELDGFSLDGNTIEVIYNAHLNNNAYVGLEGKNKNDVYLEYSNNPNVDGSGETGTTPKDTVWVFTFEMPNTKYDATESAKKALAGAGFVLYKEETGEGDVTRKYAKIGEGGKIQGWLNATKTPEGEWTLPEGYGMVTSDATGSFNIHGLDNGTYYLHEQVTPPGFNTVADVKVEIIATHKEESTGATATRELKVNGVTNEKVDVDNKKGATLPETGGIGTTIFYVLGSILVVGAVILLVTKKRMSVEK